MIDRFVLKNHPILITYIINSFSVQGYRQGYCMFEGNLMEHLNKIKDERTCQLACQNVPGCKYYIYDIDTKDCQLLDSSSRNCDLIKVVKRTDQTEDFDETCVPT